MALRVHCPSVWRMLPNLPYWILIAQSTGCAEGGRVQPGLTTIDSAGVQIVTLTQLDLEGETWMSDSTPRVEIGRASGSEPMLLNDVRAAGRLRDGRLVVANSGSRELRYFAPDGNWLTTVGGDGEGPGEFRSVSFLAVLAGDSVLVYDRSLQRVTVLDSAGGFVKSWSTIVAGAPILQDVVGVTSTGDVVMYAFVGAEPQTVGPYTTPQVIGVFDRASESYSVIDTIAGSEAAQVRREGRLVPAIRPFGRKSDIAVAGPHIVVLDAEVEQSIQVYSPDGHLVRAVRFDVPRQRIDSRLVNAWIESFFDRYTFAAERVEDSWRYGFERTSAPEEVPLFRSLEVDRQGNVCAERYGPTETATWVYWCFTPDGRFARRVVLPNDFVLRDSPTWTRK